ncbi:zinc protease [Granulicella pectinivorans]|uniref:Zinc protease n=1 Tax=Granulicella pectinivorans TaxID=474950 RepID=A0A1I6MBG4_9BACT|nr:pitrilysin family protein [Granulicella pectinivorans]SFS12957.1 zinc protease [Granulicella pectinivorans]
MTIRPFLAALMAVSLVPIVLAAPPAGKPLKLPEIKFEKYTLPNGLTVITHEDHRLPLVAVDLWYHVGPLNERAGRTGFAHLFEHMMFEGSEHVGEKAHIKFVQGAGATDVNGTTSFDRTNYFETLPANQLELGLWLESDRMGFLMEGLDRVKLANQRDVVRNERRQGEGQPYELANEKMYQLLFPKEHPYYADVIGSHADIEAARIADIRDFHQQFYTPNNASIAIAGDFDPVKLKALLTKYFGPIPKGPAVAPVNVETPAITAQRRAVVTDTVKLPELTIAWLTPGVFQPGSDEADVAMFALGGAKASRLDQALVYKTQVAQRVTCQLDAEKLAGIAECDVIAKPGVKLEDLEATVWSEIAKLQADGPTEEEVTAAKAVHLTRKITGLQRLGGFGGVADTLNQYNQYTGDPGYLVKDVASQQAVTASGAKAAAAKYFTKDSAVVVYTVAGKKELNDVPRSPGDTDADVKIVNPYSEAFETEQAWRKTPPAPGPALSFHLPVPKTFTLKNGLKVYFVEDKNLPVLSAQVEVRAGSENTPFAKAGLASLTGATMGEATTTRDLTQLAEAQEKIGTRINLGTTMDGMDAALTVTTNNADQGLELLADVMQHPAFADKDFDRMQKQRLVAISQVADSPQAIAQRVGPLLIYGEHPYGASATGTLDSVKALSKADLVEFYKQHYGPADAALTLVGDVNEAEAKRLAEKYFGGWTGTARAGVKLAPAPAAPQRHIVIVDKPGAPQTALFAFGQGVPITTPDLQAIQVMNYTLGGSFGSRINMNLREEHGYTYGAQSAYQLYAQGGGFLAGGLVRTDITGPAAKELMYEISRFPTAPPTDAELTMAKDARVHAIPALFETTSATAGALGSIFLYNRPLDYYTTLPEKYSKVTAADVIRVAKEDVHPINLIIVAVGDKAKIEQGLKDTNLGPIEVRTPTGELVK